MGTHVEDIKNIVVQIKYLSSTIYEFKLKLSIFHCIMLWKNTMHSVFVSGLTKKNTSTVSPYNLRLILYSWKNSPFEAVCEVKLPTFHYMYLLHSRKKKYPAL